MTTCYIDAWSLTNIISNFSDNYDEVSMFLECSKPKLKVNDIILDYFAHSITVFMSGTKVVGQSATKYSLYFRKIVYFASTRLKSKPVFNLIANISLPC